MNDTELRATLPALRSLGWRDPSIATASGPTASGPGGTPPSPPSGPPGQGPGRPDSEGDIDVEERQKTARPRRYKVVFHNDDYTTMEFVVDVLRHFFHKSETEALHIMLTVHKKGSAVAGIYPRDVAETKVSEVTRHARENGMPLLVTAEPE
jgi:ATP-dependent Clp protease adaptor protein ClpS